MFWRWRHWLEQELLKERSAWSAKEALRQETALRALVTVQEGSAAAIKSLLEQASEARRAASELRAEAGARAIQDREAYLAAITALRDVAEAQSQAVQQVAKAIEGYMGLFNWQGQVKGHVSDDFAEWAAEQQALKDQGFPVQAPPASQLAWILQQTDQESA